MKIFEQLELDLFTPPTFNDILIQRSITSLSISFNKRLKKSWKTLIKRNKHKELILPPLLEHSSVKIKNALIDGAILKQPRSKKKLREYNSLKKDTDSIVKRYLNENGFSQKEEKINNPSKHFIHTQGEIYNLSDIFTYLNLIYFRGEITSHLRWGNYASKKSYKNSFEDENDIPFNLITVGGVYNHPAVPEFAIKAVIFHEMLHIAIPPYQKDGINIIHGSEFKKREKDFPHYIEWYYWKKKELAKLSRSLKKKRDNND